LTFTLPSHFGSIKKIEKTIVKIIHAGFLCGSQH
jgi:hypothetical protein